VRVGSGEALVIAGSPPMTYWLPGRNGALGELIIPIAWNIEFNAPHLRAVSDQATESDFRDLGITFRNGSTECLLVAACDSGPNWVYGVAPVALAYGQYRVRFAEVMNDDLQVKILRFVRANEASG
jgi:hypothetical protein